MTIEINEALARVTKRGVIVSVFNGHSYHSITITKSSWKFLQRECAKAHPKQVAFNQMLGD